MSDLHTLQAQVQEQSDILGHSKDPSVIFLFLLEELGEAARAYLKETGHKETNDRVTESLKQELGDVMLLLLRLAAVTDTDLEASLQRTMKKIQASESSL